MGFLDKIESLATNQLNKYKNKIFGEGDEASGSLFNSRASGEGEDNSYYRDDQWVMQSFIVTKDNLEAIDASNRKFTSAAFKYTDSSLGGNHCINPPPQFTRYADVREKGLLDEARNTTLSYAPGHLGQGSYYSEAIDDNNQIIHMRFGVPSYNSLTQFFTGFYNSSAAGLARTGRLDASFGEKFLRFAVGVVTFAIMPLLILPVAFMMAGNAVRFFMRWPSSKFYYLKPSMHTYWMAVSSMVNQIAVAKGIVNFVIPKQYETIIGEPINFTPDDLSIFNQIFPEFKANGLIDVYAIANKSKRLEMRFRNNLTKQLSQAGDEGWYGKIKQVHDENSGLSEASPNESTTFALESYIQKWLDTPFLSKPSDGIEKDLRQGKDISGMDAAEAAKLMSNEKYESQEDPDGFMDFFLASEADGSEWASFRVDYTGPVSESFSNSTSPSTLAQKLNSASASARNLKINFADGNVDSLGITKSVLSGIGTVMSGVADVLQIGGLAAFAGNAFVDIPDHWESSSASLPKSTYTMTLISPYGNPISQLMYIYMPLCMILAGGLPISTGKQSYQSPFLCELYDRGRSITRLGIIDSISIQRGTSNLGFNNEGNAMAIEVSFSIKDMSSIISMPISQGFSAMPLAGVFDDENAFSDYIMAMSGVSLRNATDRLPLLKMQLARKWADIETFTSASRFASYTAQLPIASSLGAFLRGTEKS